MELNITELDNNFYHDEFADFSRESYTDKYNFQFESKLEYEKIPENSSPVPVKVIKKGVQFDNSVIFPQKPIHQSIPKSNAKMTRPQIPPKKPKISYEDILSKMGMYVSNNQLHLIDRNTLTPQQKELLNSNNQFDQTQQTEQNYKQSHTVNNNNSYIYNKYFKEDIQQQNNIRKPNSLHEYKMMLVDDYLERHRIKQMKSTKLVMPTTNINIAAGHSGDLNKLFGFSKR